MPNFYRITFYAIFLTLCTTSSAWANEAEASAALPMDPLMQSAVECNNASLQDKHNLWQMIREGAALETVNPELVAKYEIQYAAQEAYLLRIFERTRPFLFLIATELKERHMPMDLALLPIVESAYRAQATSSKGAAGLWQFMPATGQDYQLSQTWDFDGRRDVVQSTQAALKLLQDLYRQFKNWPLALAAYNWGPGNVSRAIKKVLREGKKPIYENLRMPNETRHYVPKLLAIRNILLATPKYGLRLEALPNEPQLAIVTLDKNMDMVVAAKLADMPLETFQALNSSYKLPTLVADKNRTIVIAAQNLKTFQENLMRWGERPLTNWKVYIPNSDTSVEVLAQSFAMKPSELANLNHINEANVKAGQPLLVANVEQKPLVIEAPSVIVTTSVSQETAQIREVANTTPINNTNVAVSDTALPSPPLNIEVLTPPNKTPTTQTEPTTIMAQTQIMRYKVQRGDTLSSIAREYHLSVEHIKAINQLSSNRILRGQILNLYPVTIGIFKKTKQDKPPVKASRITVYTVKKGDTLYEIARSLGVSMKQIQAPHSGKIRPGQKLRIVY